MNKKQKKAEKKILINPDGYNLTVYSLMMYMGILWGGFALSVLLCCLLINGWWILLGLALSYLFFWVIAHKVSEASVNIKFADYGFEVRRLSGSKHVPEYRKVMWANVKRYSSGVKYIILRERGDSVFKIYFPIFALFERRKSQRDIFYSFQNVFFKLVWRHRIPC